MGVDRKYNVTAALVVYAGRLDQVQRRKVIEMVDHYADEMLKASDKVRDPIRIHQGLTMFIDKAVKEDLEAPPKVEYTCTKGCHECCRQAVAITSVEAISLVDYAKRNSIQIDSERLKRQVKFDDSNWHTLPKEDRDCPFLSKEGLCQVYEIRPLTCRKYYVVSDPDKCNMDKHPGGGVSAWMSLEVETITTAAFTIYGSNHMPIMLLTALSRENS